MLRYGLSPGVTDNSDEVDVHGFTASSRITTIPQWAQWVITSDAREDQVTRRRT